MVRVVRRRRSSLRARCNERRRALAAVFQVRWSSATRTAVLITIASTARFDLGDVELALDGDAATKLLTAADFATHLVNRLFGQTFALNVCSSKARYISTISIVAACLIVDTTRGAWCERKRCFFVSEHFDGASRKQQ